MFKLKRIGKKNQPAFRIVITEKRSKLVSASLEELGWLNPISKDFSINKERVSYWLSKGAKPTDTLHNLFVKARLIAEHKIAVHKKAKGGSETEKVLLPSKAEKTEEGGKTSVDTKASSG